MDALTQVRRLIEMGHFNYPCSTEVDVKMAERAIESAIRIAARTDDGAS